MRNKQSTGKALAHGKRVRHRGVMYRITGSQAYREHDCSFVGWLHVGYAGDARSAIDNLLSGKKPRLRPTPKRRRYGRIHPARRIL